MSAEHENTMGTNYHTSLYRHKDGRKLYLESFRAEGGSQGQLSEKPVGVWSFGIADKELVKKIEEKLGCKTYFCDPYCAWQKGTNENSNGLLREFYPKGMDLSEVDEKELKNNLSLLNNRPRKCIKYKTPNEIIFNNSH